MNDPAATALAREAATRIDLPAPSPDDAPAAWDVVIGRVRAQRARWADGNPTPAMDATLEMMHERDRFGAKKYGMRLQPFNGQDPLREAIQEALDLCAYLANEHSERGDLASSMELDLAIHMVQRLVGRYLKTRVARESQ